MKCLLDTHTLIWALTDPIKLSQNVRHIIEDDNNQIVVSSISFWEVSLKYALRKLDLISLRPEDFLSATIDSNFLIEPLPAEICATYHQLDASHHRDPFDRMLVWLAIRRQYTLISVDSNIRKYADGLLKVVW